MNEITPVLNRCKSDFANLLTTEEVDKFEYVRRCWYETMRIQPPTSNTTPNVFSQTVRIEGIDFTPSTNFIINFDTIHNDPKEWVQPQKYDPDRFDPTSKMFLRPDGSPRNPYSFCPFFGGKRICLGKTLAESMTVYTIPLIMYHLEFEYVNPDHFKVKPNF